MSPPTREDIQRIVDRIVEGYRPEKIILFGSSAWGTPGEDSDVDLFIIKETDENPFHRRVRVRRMASDRQRRTPVDYIVMTPAEVRGREELGDPFVRMILERGVVLHAA